MAEVLYDLFGPIRDEIETEEDCLSDTLLGRYAEFMVCAQLTKAGDYVTHVDGVGFDLILQTGEGSFTIQVKSTRDVQNRKFRPGCRWGITLHDAAGGFRRNGHVKKRRITPRDADLLALYHHVFETTIILPIIGEMPVNYTFPLGQVQVARIEDSLRTAMAVLS